MLTKGNVAEKEVKTVIKVILIFAYQKRERETLPKVQLGDSSGH